MWMVIRPWCGDRRETHVTPDYEETAVRFRQLCEGLAEMRGYL